MTLVICGVSAVSCVAAGARSRRAGWASRTNGRTCARSAPAVVREKGPSVCSVLGSPLTAGVSAISAGPAALAMSRTSVSARPVDFSVFGSCAIERRSATSWVATACRVASPAWTTWASRPS